MQETMVIDPKMKVSEIARLFPQSMRVFERFGLDLCCGGVHPLEVAAERRGLDLAKVLKELEAAVRGGGPRGTQP